MIEKYFCGEKNNSTFAAVADYPMAGNMSQLHGNEAEEARNI